MATATISSISVKPREPDGCRGPTKGAIESRVGFMAMTICGQDRPSEIAAMGGRKLTLEGTAIRSGPTDGRRRAAGDSLAPAWFGQMCLTVKALRAPDVREQLFGTRRYRSRERARPCAISSRRRR